MQSTRITYKCRCIPEEIALDVPGRRLPYLIAAERFARGPMLWIA